MSLTTDDYLELRDKMDKTGKKTIEAQRHVQTLAATILAGRLANMNIHQPAEKDAAYSVFLAHAIIKASEEWRGE